MRTWPLQGKAEEKIFILDMREGTARQLEQSRAGRESSRLYMTSGLNWAVRGEVGEDERGREMGKRGEDKESQENQERAWPTW